MADFLIYIARIKPDIHLRTPHAQFSQHNFKRFRLQQGIAATKGNPLMQGGQPLQNFLYQAAFFPLRTAVNRKERRIVATLTASWTTLQKYRKPDSFTIYNGFI